MRSPLSRGRLVLVAALVAALGLVALDLARAPERQLGGRTLVAAIGVYQATLGPLMPLGGVHCRFEPTCSHYAAASIHRHGAGAGGLRAAWRLLRCAPWTPQGTVDPP